MVITLTVGTNSWISVADADTYFSEKFGASTWATLTNDQKKQLLISAFRWIMQQSAFNISPNATADIIKQAQCELAWFIYNYYEDYDKHRAMIVAGVRQYRILDVQETLGDVTFPAFISGMLADSSTEITNAFPHVHRDLQQESETAPIDTIDVIEE